MRILRGRWIDILAGFILFALALANTPENPQTHERRPAPAPYVAREAQEPRRPQPLPEITLRDSPTSPHVKTTVGSAFAIDSAGTWLTAHHVADGCKHMFLLMPPSSTLRTRYRLTTGNGKEIPAARARVAALDHTADLALLRTQETRREALVFANEEEFTRANNQQGFGIGFPGGDPGEVATRLMGPATSVLRLGKQDVRQRSLVWSVVQLNSATGELGGISGGPLITAQGKIAGVHSGGYTHERRGRLVTVAPAELKELLSIHLPGTIKRAYQPETPLNETNFSAIADHLRQHFTVAQVVCFYR